MKKVLAILVVIASIAAMSSAATYQPTKDTFYVFDSILDGKGLGNDTWGGQAEQRCDKGWQNGFYMDFDRAAIVADITSFLGRAPVAADFTSGAVVVTLQLMSSGNQAKIQGHHQTPMYWTSTTPWTEGGSTYAYADRNAVPPTPWNTTGANMRDCPNVKGTQQTWTAADFQYQTFTIDANVASGFILSQAAGVALQMNGDDYDDARCFSREGSYTMFGQTNYAGPVLTVVPEPCSMLLMAAGAVATLIRRRK